MIEFDENLPRIYPKWKNRLVYSKIENALSMLPLFVQTMKKAGCVYKTFYDGGRTEYTLRLLSDTMNGSSYVVEVKEYIPPPEPEKKKLLN